MLNSAWRAVRGEALACIEKQAIGVKYAQDSYVDKGVPVFGPEETTRSDDEAETWPRRSQVNVRGIWGSRCPTKVYVLKHFIFIKFILIGFKLRSNQNPPLDGSLMKDSEE
ncbi:hypothetical protein EVAR_62549_1 [Eumeta japonica]|uniref:Uncharacterized protein n=1 Tax=Eumeta variegata TaxID=151549 RepID=A0A4C1YWZ8_EUMVA|nr:hypothetical protein EVAR_62549_1 [Eumeta japonica]